MPVYVTEYASMGQIAGNAQMPQEPAITGYTIAVGAGSVQGPVCDPKTRFVEITTDSVVSILIDTNPTAVTTRGRLPANATTYRGVPEGGSMRIAVIANT